MKIIRKRELDKAIWVIIAVLSMTVFGMKEDSICGLPEIPAGTEIQNYSREWNGKTAFKKGEQLIYQCRNGFRSFGPDEYSIHCQENGMWSHLALECYERMSLDDSEIQCTADGDQCKTNWTNQTCSSQITRQIKLRFQKRRTISFIQIHYLPSLNASDVVAPQITCFQEEENSNSFRLSCQLQTTSKQKRSDHLEWALTYFCKDYPTQTIKVAFLEQFDVHYLSVFQPARLRCDGIPETPLNSQMQLEHSTFTSHYTCEKGFTLIGHGTRTCNKTTGRWQPCPPLCVREGFYLRPITYIASLLCLITVAIFCIYWGEDFRNWLKSKEAFVPKVKIGFPKQGKKEHIRMDEIRQNVQNIQEIPSSSVIDSPFYENYSVERNQRPPVYANC